MDIGTIRALAELNNRFYRENHESFSDTRPAPWPGWRRVCDYLPVSERTCRVLDVASGNMRFERFMADEFPESRFEFLCIDSCSELAQCAEGARYVNLNVIDALLASHELDATPIGRSEGLPEPSPSFAGPLGGAHGRFNAAVSFGFMHHVPSRQLRESFACELLRAVKKGGVVALSFWQFMDDPRLSAQAQRATGEFLGSHAYMLDPGDYILSWNGREGAYRYCHHFASEEIEMLCSRLADSCEVLDRFNSDGRNGALNAYLVLRRRQ